METLYEILKETEKDIDEIEEAINYLSFKGFNVEGEIPKMAEEANEIMNVDFGYNYFTQRMRSGERLKDIVKDIASQRKFSLRFDKEKREEYNLKAKDLTKILPIGNWLKAHPFYSPLNPETSPLYFAAVGAGLGALYHQFFPGSGEAPMPYLAETIGASIGFLTGALNGLTTSTIIRKLPEEFKKEINFIDMALQPETQEDEL